MSSIAKVLAAAAAIAASIFGSTTACTADAWFHGGNLSKIPVQSQWTAADREGWLLAQGGYDPGDGYGPYPPGCRNKGSFDECAVNEKGCSLRDRVSCAPICSGLCDD